jgi:1-acyl-sn-glycerol-3-phosphate acyltransferase
MREQGLASMRAQVYTDTRPAEYFSRFHERARRRGPGPIYELMRIVMVLIGLLVFRVRVIDSDKVPKSGAVILAPNHFSYMDHFFLGVFIRRKLRFMAKSQLFKFPLTFIYSHGGVFPVRRGARDDEAFVTAHQILAGGGCIAMYCEGGRSRTGRLAERAKPGIGRLALESGATVVPVAIHGTARVRNWKRLQFPRITVQYGEPLRFEQVEAAGRAERQQAADVIFGEIRALYDTLQSEGRKGAQSRAKAQRRAGSASHA